MLNEGDIDMEELEAHLYGQVHYSDQKEDDTTPTINNTPSPTDAINKQTRYYTSIPLSTIFTEYAPAPQSFGDGNNYNQLGFMVNPGAFNNILVVQQHPPAQIFTKHFAKGKFEERPVKRLSRKARKRKEALQARKGLKPFKGFKQHHLKKVITPVIEHPPQVTNFKNDHACEIIEPINEVFIVSSDDETVNVKNEIKVNSGRDIEIDDSDDVIFVETEKDVVINLDAEDDLQSNIEMPDFATTEQNDFLEDSVLVNKSETAERIDLPTAPEVQETKNANGEVSDTESSCATSDSQHRMFKETSFETNCRDISSLSLNDFENYIMTSEKCLLENSGIASAKDTSIVFNTSKKRPLEESDKNSSDSSSESDYGGEQDITVSHKQATKVLPDLSHIVSDDDMIDLKDTSYKTVWSSKTTDGNPNIVCISSSDELSDLDEGMEQSIELLNIEGTIKDNPSDETVIGDYKPLRFADFWNDDMNKFYKESWGQENYSLEEERQKMPDDPKNWKIAKDDIVNSYAIPRGPRCHRCRQHGHKALNCTNKDGTVKCILCGNNGHLESKCTNKLCGSCGEKVAFWKGQCKRCSFRHLYCNICSLRGHSTANCSDLWRRYHLTVSNGPIVRPKNDSYKLSKDRWCSGCGSQGHFEHECNYYVRTHAKTIPFVYNYEDVYYNSDHSAKPDLTPSVQIPSLLDLQIDENEVLHCPSQTAFKQLNLKPLEAKHLLNNKGVAFLQHLSAGTDLQIKILKHGERKRARYVCIIQGSEHYRNDAEVKIIDYCTNVRCFKAFVRMFSIKNEQLSKNKLRDYLKRLNVSLPWASFLKDMYNTILTCKEELQVATSKDQSMKNIKTTLVINFKALNAVLIGKFNAGDQNHIKLLKKWAVSDATAIERPLQIAYNYVFENGKDARLDYERLIQNVLSEVDKSFESVEDEVNKLTSICTEFCQNLKLEKELNLLQTYHRVVIRSNYNSRRVHLFTKFCKCLMVKHGKHGKKL